MDEDHRPTANGEWKWTTTIQSTSSSYCEIRMWAKRHAGCWTLRALVWMKSLAGLEDREKEKYYFIFSLSMQSTCRILRSHTASRQAKSAIDLFVARECSLSSFWALKVRYCPTQLAISPITEDALMPRSSEIWSNCQLVVHSWQLATKLKPCLDPTQNLKIF